MGMWRGREALTGQGPGVLSKDYFRSSRDTFYKKQQDGPCDEVTSAIMSWLIRRLAPRSWTIWLLCSSSLLMFVSIVCTVGFLKISPALFSTKILKNAHEPTGATVPREPLVGSLAFFIL